MARAVFLDRDGTMVHDVGYLRRLEDLRWYPWTMDAIRLLNRAGFLVFVTSNQGGVGLGLLTEAFVQRAHEAMSDAVASAGARVDGWYYCPHHPRAIVETLRSPCECRKPEPGMVRRAQAAFDLDLSQSFVVGDRAADVGMAERTGARGVLVRTGSGVNELAQHGGAIAGTARVAENLMEAVSWILRESGHPRP